MSTLAFRSRRRSARAGVTLAACGLAAAVALTACGSPAPAASTSSSSTNLVTGEAEAWNVPQDLVDAAKAEGTVTLYTSSEQSIVDNLTSALQDKYGITLQAQRLNSSQLAQRYSAEASVKNVVADVIVTGDATLADQFGGEGWLQDIREVPGTDQWPSEFTTDKSVVLSINPYSMGINTSLIPNKPTDWKFLLDPSLKGQLITLDLKNVGLVAFAAWDLLLKTEGEDFLRQLNQQDLRLYDSGPSAVQQLAAGSGSLYFPASLTQAASMTSQGAPVEGVLPTDAPITGAETPAFLSTDAPHPNAAKLLINFMMSPDGQKILNQVASSPNGTPGTPAVPANYQRPDLASAAADKDQIIQLLGM